MREESGDEGDVFAASATACVPAKKVARSVSFVGVEDSPEVESRASHSRVAVGMEEFILHNEFERCEYELMFICVFLSLCCSGVGFGRFYFWGDHPGGPPVLKFLG